MIYDIIVIGGGPAGMIAAGKAASMSKKVLLIEKNEKLGKKLYLTGKGRCNITNTASLEDFLMKIPKNTKFMYSSLSSFFNVDIVQLLNSLGLETKIERGDRVFPFSDKSSDVIKHLEKYMRMNNVLVMLNTKVISIKSDNGVVRGVELSTGEFLTTKSVIIATGGLSYPMTGSDGDGYKFAEDLGHKVTDLYPALVPLIVKESYIKELQGLTLKNVTISLKADEEVLYSDFGELLFTHYGLSGPLILTASYYAIEALRKNKNLSVFIDLKPYMDYEELDRRLLKDFEKFINKNFNNSLNELLPKKLIPVIVKLSKISGIKPVNKITKKEREGLVTLLKGLKFEIIDTRPIKEAIITCGGISVKEINPKTMESKLIKGLFFAGELIDVIGFTGGYNLQIAFSTGYAAGTYA